MNACSNETGRALHALQSRHRWVKVQSDLEPHPSERISSIRRPATWRACFVFPRSQWLPGRRATRVLQTPRGMGGVRRRDIARGIPETQRHILRCTALVAGIHEQIVFRPAEEMTFQPARPLQEICPAKHRQGWFRNCVGEYFPGGGATNVCTQVITKSE